MKDRELNVVSLLDEIEGVIHSMGNTIDTLAHTHKYYAVECARAYWDWDNLKRQVPTEDATHYQEDLSQAEQRLNGASEMFYQYDRRLTPLERHYEELSSIWQRYNNLS